MIDEDRLREIHQSLVDHKEHLWDSHGERDMDPMMVLHFGNQFPDISVPGEMIAQAMAENDCNLATIVDMVFDTMPDDMLQHLEMLRIGSDAYQQIVDTLAEAKELQHGDMAQEFKTSADTDITEMIFTMVATNDLVGGCDIQAMHQTYVITDGGFLVWGSPSIDETDAMVQGPLVETIERRFRREL